MKNYRTDGNVISFKPMIEANAKSIYPLYYAKEETGQVLKRTSSTEGKIRFGKYGKSTVFGTKELMDTWLRSWLPCTEEEFESMSS
ncbi:MAG: hypothetical protein AAF363_14390 [Bacteroidota bacterium]